MKILAIAVLAASAMFAPMVASAETDVSYNVGVTSDYIWRGVTQNDRDAAASVGVDVVHDSGVYAGAWASEVNFNDNKTKAEVDLYAGYKTQLGAYTVDVGGIYYAYPDQVRGSDASYGEVKVAVSRPVLGVNVTGSLFYSPETYGNGGETFYTELAASKAVTDRLTLSGAVGNYDFEHGDYVSWNAGGTYQINDVVSVDVRYHDADLWNTNDRVVVSLKSVF